MMNVYFDTNESKSHLEAKEKLFDLITSKRIEIVDQNGTVYDIFKGEHEDEFLHIESFLMDYSPDVIFSNKESPCKKFMEEYKKSPQCNIEGYFGAFKELPCEKCVVGNFGKYMEGSSKFASYRPDISFGYKGKHKVWLEIKNESPCSKNKIEFCKNNGIVLLEIDSSDVNRFKEFNGQLVFNRLEEYIHKVNIYEVMDDIVNYVNKKLKENESKYVLQEELAEYRYNKLNENRDLTTGRNLMKLMEKLEEEFYALNVDNKELKNYFNLKRKSSIIISNDTYRTLVDKGLILNAEKQIEYLFTSVGYISSNSLKKLVNRMINKDKKRYINKFNEDNGYKRIRLNKLLIGKFKEKWCQH